MLYFFEEHNLGRPNGTLISTTFFPHARLKLMRASERPWFNLEAAVSGEHSTVRGETIHGNAKIANSSANIS